ncbi:DUF6048 family protein [Chitinophagaceae bacterium MMS25-I14]
MLLRHTRYYLVIFCAMLAAQMSYAQTDSTKKKPAFDLPHQLRIEFDASRPVTNAIMKNHSSYEISADYHIGNENYLVLEGGFGNADIDYSDLKYKSKNSFARIGINKAMLPRITAGDWDVAFIGVRYGLAFIDRSDATYTTSAPIWGTTTGNIEGKKLTAHWGEITGGVRVELFKGIFTGWNIRGKFLFNQGAFKELPPAYIAGYGKGDKNTIFDFNFYLGYALRWKAKKVKK